MTHLSSTAAPTPNSYTTFRPHTVATFQGCVRRQQVKTPSSLSSLPVDCFHNMESSGRSRSGPLMFSGMSWKQGGACSSHLGTVRSSSIQLSKLQQGVVQSPRVASTALGHSYRCPPESEHNFMGEVTSRDKLEALKLPPGMFAEAVTKGLAYSIVHPLVLMRTRSIAAGLQRPGVEHLFPLTVLGSCATQSAVEYALALFLSRRVNAIFDKFLESGSRGGEVDRAHDRTPKSLLLLKNFVAAMITAGPSLAWSRVNQQLMLGHDLSVAVKNILGEPASILQKNPAMAKEFLRGLPIAVLCLTVYLMIQDLTQAKSEPVVEASGEGNSAPKNALRSGKFWAVANMAFIGFLDGVVDSVVGTAQLHGVSTVKAATRTFSGPLTPLAHGVLGAVSLGMLELSLKTLTSILVKKQA